MATLPGESIDAAGRFHAPGITRPGDLTPETYKLPSLAATKNLSNGQLMGLAQRYGFYTPDRELRADAQAYVKQFAAIPEKSKDFWKEVDRITKPEGGRGAALKMARRSQRRYQTLAVMAGSGPNPTLIRIGEDDSESCDGCIERSGTEGTMAEQRAVGLPGHQECGENCRCTLSAVDKVNNTTGGLGWLLAGAMAAAVISEVLEDDESEYLDEDEY